MIVAGVTFALFACLTMISMLHGLGFWLFLMVTHGIFYQIIGTGSEHLPFYGGLAVLAVILVRRRWAGVSFGLLGLVLAFMIAMALAGLFGINQQNSLITILLFAKGLLLVLLLAGTLQTERDIKVMTLYCLAGLAVGGGFAIYQYFTGTLTISTIYVQRAATLRGDPNDTAMLLVAGVPLCLYWLSTSRGKMVKLAAFVSLGTLLAGIVLTGSRGGFVALLLVLMAIFLRRPSLRLFTVGLLSVSVVAVLAPQGYWDRMKTLVTGKEQHLSKSLSNRVRLQRVGIEVFFNNPLIGVGPGNFSQAFFIHTNPENRPRISTNLSEGKTFAVAHNMYLEFFAENGLLGGLLLLSIFFLSIRQLLQFDRLTGAARNQIGLGFSLSLALGGMLFAGLFLSQGKNSVLWFMVGIGFAIGMINARKRLSVNRETQVCDAKSSPTPLAESL